jgi:hypothetical protein
VGALTNANVAEKFGPVISAPLVEESAKGAILFVFFFFKKDEFDGIIDGIVYAGMVGLGFAMSENIMYYGRALDGGSLTFVFFLRGLIAPFSHPLFTSMTGIGLGWARQSDNLFIKITMPVLGLMLAMLMHGIWNGSATLGGGLGFVLAYVLVMGPVFIITLMVIYFGLRHEGRIVQQFLYPDLQTGMFEPAEYQKLCSIAGRMSLSWTALMSQGFSAWRVRMRCNQLASELAFHRSRVSRGIVVNDQANYLRERAYLQTLAQQRALLRR